MSNQDLAIVVLLGFAVLSTWAIAAMACVLIEAEKTSNDLDERLKLIESQLSGWR